MQQNKYDDPEFFEIYSTMPRSLHGLDAAYEWPMLRSMLPDLRGKRVLDLGCGYGWHCRYLREQGARSVVGVDISRKMLERARELTDDAAIEYRQMPIEEIDFPASTFDVVISSLALHYIEGFGEICGKVQRCLVEGGSFVFSVEHPIFSAREAQDWHYGPDGNPLHWPVDNYQRQGVRHTSWLADDVVKYHRTIESYVNAMLDAGFALTRLVEPGPTPEMLEEHPEWSDETRRPIFLLLAANRL